MTTQLILLLIPALMRATRRVFAAWQCRRQARASSLALHALDTRTLHDLGLRREEIPSIAAELAGCAEATRQRALLTGHGAAF